MRPAEDATSTGTDTAAAPPASRSDRVRLFFLLGLLSTFGPLSIDMYLPALPALGADLHAGEAQVQLTLTACLVGVALGQIVAGPLSDVRGRRRPLLAGVGAYALTSLLCALAPTVGLLVGMRLLQGIAGGAGVVIARAVVRDLYSGISAARYFSYLMLVNGLAPILAPVMGGQLLRFTSWHGEFVGLAVIGALLFVSAAVGLRETLPMRLRRTGGPADSVRVMAMLVADREFMSFALASGLAFGALFAYIAGSSFVLEGHFGLSPQAFGAVFASNALGIVLAGQLNARLLGRVSPYRLLLSGLTSIAGSGVLLVVITVAGVGLTGLLPVLFLMVASIGFVIPNATALALSGHARAAGTGSALLGLIQFGTGAVVAPLSGALGAGSVVAMSVVIAALGLLALGALLGLGRRPRAEEHSRTPSPHDRSN